MSSCRLFILHTKGWHPWCPGQNHPSAIIQLRETWNHCNRMAPSQPNAPPTPPVYPEYPFQYLCSDFFHYKGHKEYIEFKNIKSISSEFLFWIQSRLLAQPKNNENSPMCWAEWPSSLFCRTAKKQEVERKAPTFNSTRFKLHYYSTLLYF